MTEDQKLAIQKIVLAARPWKIGDTFENRWRVILGEVYRETGLLLRSLTTDKDGMPIEWW